MFVKKFLKRLFFTLIFLSTAYVCYFLTDVKVRQDLKKQCQGDNCPCFNNIVDYRLKRNQAVVFLNYLKSRQIRPDTKILEFTDLDNATEIVDVFSVCQSVQTEQSNPVDTTQEQISSSEMEETTLD